MYFENSKIELDDLRFKIKTLQQINNNVVQFTKGASESMKKFSTDISKNVYNIKFNGNESLLNTNLFTSIEEMETVEKCFRKSIELVNKYYNAKKLKKRESLNKKHMSNKKNTIHGQNELCNNLQFANICRKLKKCDNQISLKCEDINISPPSSNFNNFLRNAKRRENKTVENCDIQFLTLSSNDQSSESYNKLNRKKFCVKNTHFKRSESYQNIRKVENNISKAEKEPDIIYLDTVSSQLCDPNHVEIITTNHKKNEFNCFTHKNYTTSVSVGGKSENAHLNLIEEQEKYLTGELEREENIIQEWDFTEEPVDFTVPPLHIRESVHNSVMSTKRSDLTSYNKWSKKEIALLIRNYNDFTSQFKINDPCLLLGLGKRTFFDKNEAKNLKKFIKAKHFYVRLGKDINHRTLQHIYQKARLLFDPVYKKQNKFTNINLLLHLQKKYGSNWFLISRKLGQSPGKCSYHYRTYEQR